MLNLCVVVVSCPAYARTQEPFSATSGEIIFQTAQFLMNGLRNAPAPHGVSKVLALFALAKQGKVRACASSLSPSTSACSLVRLLVRGDALGACMPC